MHNKYHETKERVIYYNVKVIHLEMKTEYQLGWFYFNKSIYAKNDKIRH